MEMNGEEGLEYKVHVDGICLKHVSEFKYLGYIYDKSGIDGAECSRKVASRSRVAGVIRSLVNAKDLQIKCARVLHETSLLPVLMYGRRDLGLRLYRWTTSEDILLLGE